MVTDSVLAAIIAGTATLSASFLQLKSAALREAARGPSAAARRKNRLQRFILLAIVGAAGVSGFALSQWLNEGERAAQGALQRELQARIEEISRTTNELAQTREGARADIEAGVLRRLGGDGVAVVATVAPCRPALAPGTAGASPPSATAEAPPAPAAHACTESEASPVALCASIPANATVIEVALFSRAADSDTPWSANRFLPGQESGQARFAEKYTESAPDAGTRQVCQTFAHWSAEHARVVRLLVRYSL
jgi:hypothetical protein